jgi:hypothetical protein
VTAPPDLQPEPGDEPFQGWTMRARVLGDRVVAKAKHPSTGRTLSSGPQPTRAHAFSALREAIVRDVGGPRG